MKYFLLLTFQFFITLSLHAQRNTSLEKVDVGNEVNENSSLRISNKPAFQRYKWDVSVDGSFVLPAINYVTYVSTFGPPNSQGSFTNVAGSGYYGYITGTSTFQGGLGQSARFLVRKNETVYNRTNIAQRQGAYRFSASLGGGSENIRNDSLFLQGTNGLLVTTGTGSIHVGGSVGYEWQHQLGRFQGYYGYDVGAYFSRYTQTVKVVNSTTRKTSESADITDNALFASAAALAGVKFFLHPRFSLGLESTYTISYSRRAYEGILPADFSKQRFKADGFYFKLIPIAAINATFHFGDINP